MRVEGLERVKRGGEKIPVTEYDGHTIPFDDNAYDAVILADVLHHDHTPDRLLDECARVASRTLFIKDPARRGPLAQQRISLIDWAANAPYGVPCLYRYNTLEQWRDSHAKHSLSITHERTSINLYPPMVNLLFGRALQYFVALDTRDPGAAHERRRRHRAAAPRVRSAPAHWHAPTVRACRAIGPSMTAISGGATLSRSPCPRSSPRCSSPASSAAASSTTSWTATPTGHPRSATAPCQRRSQSAPRLAA